MANATLADGSRRSSLAGDGALPSWARQVAELNAYFEQYMQNRREDG